MIKRTLLITALAVPLTALALEIQPADFYSDVRAGSHEAAGINMLTREGVIQGYGDRTFGPTRIINRAEFLKIAIAASGGASESTAKNCFPDVSDQWFAQYVCTAFTQGIVKGYIDGLFHPERTVTYGEALKMLSLLFGYEISESSSPEWAQQYYDAAVVRGTDLPIRITFDTPMTRGMAARLAGAFVAEKAGLLSQYRLAEAGQYGSSGSSSSSASSVSSSTSSSLSSSVSSSSSSSVTSLFTLPAISRFLIVGSTTDALASGTLRMPEESAKVQIVQVKLFSEVRSINYLELVKEDGTVIATLLRRTNTDAVDYKLTFEAQIQPEKQVTIPKDTDVNVALRAVVRSVDNAGFSDELLQVRTANVTLKGDLSNHTVNIPLNGPFPKHQTAFGRIANVTRISPANATLTSGTGVLMGSFAFSGAVIPGKTLKLRQLVFSLSKVGSTSLSNWMLVNRHSGMWTSCTLNEQALTITCSALEQAVGIVSGTLTLDLKATVHVPAGTHDSIVQVSLPIAGTPESLGSIEWTDESGVFRWIEGPSPIVEGTKFQS